MPNIITSLGFFSGGGWFDFEDFSFFRYLREENDLGITPGSLYLHKIRKIKSEIQKYPNTMEGITENKLTIGVLKKKVLL